MTRLRISLLTGVLYIVILSCNQQVKTESTSEDNPAPELVRFNAIEGNPVFSGTGDSTWDKHIRERGYILKEDDGYHMWYTGYASEKDGMRLGYATSPDGITWTRHASNPIHTTHWVEDMCVIKVDSTYYMFAEGRGDTAHLMTSVDRIHWTEQGDLNIKKKNGEPIEPGPYGTPTIWRENGRWWLFYERGDLGIWVATSDDLKVWTNVQDDPVIALGPDAYDKYGVAMNQIIKHNGKYYGYYHATAFEDWREWSTNVAVSDDLIHWKKYKGNPILGENKSSGILVHDGRQYRMYTMHDRVVLHYPVKGE